MDVQMKRACMRVGEGRRACWRRGLRSASPTLAFLAAAIVPDARAMLDPPVCPDFGEPFLIDYLGPNSYSIRFKYCPGTGYLNPGRWNGKTYFAQLRWQESRGGEIKTYENNTGGQCGRTRSERYAGGCYHGYRYSGPPGSRISVAYQFCRRGEFLAPSTCSGWREEFAQIPMGLPQAYEHPVITRVEPATYLLRRLRPQGDTPDVRAVVGHQKTRIRVHLRGSLDEVPRAPFTNWGYKVTFRVSWRNVERTEFVDIPTGVKKRKVDGEWVEAKDVRREGSSLVFAIPDSAFEQTWCDRECAPIELSIVPSRQRYYPVWDETPKSSDVQKAVIRIRSHYAPKEDPLISARWANPPTIVSSCGEQAAALGIVHLRVRQDNDLGAHSSRPEGLQVDLQYRSDEGLWGESALQRALKLQPGSQPAEFHAVLSKSAMLKSSRHWRWRARAASGEQSSPWCELTVSDEVDGYAKRMPGAMNAPVQAQARAPRMPPDPGAPSAAPQAVPSSPMADAAGTQASSVLAMDKAAMRARGVPESGVDRPGADFRTLPGGSFQECQTACAVDATCRAWTWVKPGVQGPQGKCWLKNGVPNVVHNDCCTSGVK
jgi:hypothetical protein